MSSDDLRTAAGSADTDETDEPTERATDELRAELELLRERNRRLQDSYTRARQTRYRRTAQGLIGLGVLGILGSVLFPGVRDILLVLGATGLFGGVLTYYLTPEQFVAADVGRAVHTTVADDRDGIIDELGLTNTWVYVPVGDTNTRVRLFVPHHDEYTIPPDDDLETVHVVPADSTGRGVAFRPTGDTLFHDFVDAQSESLGETPGALATQLPDALVEQFGLVDQTRTDLDAENGRLTVGVLESVYGPVTRIDHPVASFLAVGLARGLGHPVTVEVYQADDDRADYRITLRWADEQ